MIKLTAEKLQNAIRRARELRPRVRMVGERRYSVTGHHRRCKWQAKRISE